MQTKLSKYFWNWRTLLRPLSSRLKISWLHSADDEISRGQSWDLTCTQPTSVLFFITVNSSSFSLPLCVLLSCLLRLLPQPSLLLSPLCSFAFVLPSQFFYYLTFWLLKLFSPSLSFNILLHFPARAINLTFSHYPYLACSFSHFASTQSPSFETALSTFTFLCSCLLSPPHIFPSSPSHSVLLFLAHMQSHFHVFFFNPESSFCCHTIARVSLFFLS